MASMLTPPDPAPPLPLPLPPRPPLPAPPPPPPQVLFLLYHYFNAKEIYNAIRVFIAGYVWMTGFGNFAYYYKTGDFGLGRFCQMMWRLNFLVTLCCLALNNSYMLYYICPMHTLFTVMVYGGERAPPRVGICITHRRAATGLWRGC